ncbi:hypothetical protein AB0C52_12280 [Streptomyces sp. NPDC048717]|uniref:hypothetical protein n=1 Tax=Streptomyces sp. NPDC048717 TaxID=3154928 RepID=UPI00343DEBC2
MTSPTALANPDRLSGLVADLAAEVEPALLDPARLSQVLRVADQFPRDLSEFVGLECRLNRESAPVDFMFCVGKAAHERAALARSAARAHQASGDLRSGWGPLAEFAAAWADPASVLHTHVRDIWLEFDLDSPDSLDSPGPLDAGAPVPPLPSVFLDIDPGAAHSGAMAGLLDEVSALFAGAWPDPAHRSFLSHCLRATTIRTSRIVLGLLLPRRADYLRVCVQGLTGGRLLDCLDATGWPGRRRDLLPVLTSMAPTVDCLTLDLDVAAGIRPRLGVEYMFHSRLRQGAPPPWGRALNRLSRLGLCRPELAGSLLRFGTSGPGPGAGDPAGGSPGGAGTWRRLNHLKVVHTPDEPPEAKCYLFARRMEA